MIAVVASFSQMKKAEKFEELMIQLTYYSHPCYILYGIINGVQRQPCEAYSRMFL